MDEQGRPERPLVGDEIATPLGFLTPTSTGSGTRPRRTLPSSCAPSGGRLWPDPGCPLPRRWMCRWSTATTRRS